jgi:hypothetical protein
MKQLADARFARFGEHSPVRSKNGSLQRPTALQAGIEFRGTRAAATWSARASSSFRRYVEELVSPERVQALCFILWEPGVHRINSRLCSSSGGRGVVAESLMLTILLTLLSLVSRNVEPHHGVESKLWSALSVNRLNLGWMQSNAWDYEALDPCLCR